MSTRASVAQIRSLGFAWPEIANEQAVLVGRKVDLDATIERLRVSKDRAQRERAEARAVAARWNAPLSDVTDRDEGLGERMLAVDGAIAALETIRQRVQQAGPLPELDEDRVEALPPKEVAQEVSPPEPPRVAVPRDPPKVLPAVPPRPIGGGPLPSPIAASLFESVACKLVVALGLPFPDDVPKAIASDDDPKLRSTTTTWSHEGVTIATDETVEVYPGPFDSPDVYWSARITGLPGPSSITFHATHDVFDKYSLTGDEARKAEISRAIESVFGALLRARSKVRGILPPRAWCERAMTVDPGRLTSVLRIHRWALEPLDASGSGWFAVESRGEIYEGSGVTIDPIGPLPRVLGLTYVDASRSGYSVDKTPPSLDQLGEAFAGVPLPSTSEELVQSPSSLSRTRRARAGRWVFQENVYDTEHDGKFMIQIRVQSEEGGTHAVLVSGNYNLRGWGEMTIEIIGHPVSRNEVMTRLDAWARITGWTLMPRWESEPA